MPQKKILFVSYDGLRLEQDVPMNSLVLSDEQRASATSSVVQQLIPLIPPANFYDPDGTLLEVRVGRQPRFAAVKLGVRDVERAAEWWSEVVGLRAADGVLTDDRGADSFAVELLAGKTPKAEATLFDTPSKLFVPAIVTSKNLKAEIIDKKIATADQLCGGRYAEGCKKLGITQ